MGGPDTRDMGKNRRLLNMILRRVKDAESCVHFCRPWRKWKREGSTRRPRPPAGPHQEFPSCFCQPQRVGPTQKLLPTRSLEVQVYGKSNFQLQSLFLSLKFKVREVWTMSAHMIMRCLEYRQKNIIYPCFKIFINIFYGHMSLLHKPCYMISLLFMSKQVMKPKSILAWNTQCLPTTNRKWEY